MKNMLVVTLNKQALYNMQAFETISVAKGKMTVDRG